MNKFRPQNLSKKHVMQERLLGGRPSYNWQTRVKWYPVGWKLNHKVLGNIHSRLHYLAGHAPAPVQKQWRAKYKVFMNKHFGDAGKASMRYLNQWSCHSWM